MPGSMLPARTEVRARGGDLDSSRKPRTPEVVGDVPVLSTNTPILATVAAGATVSFGGDS